MSNQSFTLNGKVVNCFLKCEADRRGTLRGRRQIMLDDSDVHHHRHSKAAVGSIALPLGAPVEVELIVEVA